MSTCVFQSTFVERPIDVVWRVLRPLDFKWNGIAVSCSMEQGAAPTEVGGIRSVAYSDDTIQKYKLTELSDAQYFVTFDLIESVPHVDFSSATHTIKLRRITSNNWTFVEWTTDFSKDASDAVIQDSKYKKEEQFQALRNYLHADRQLDALTHSLVGGNKEEYKLDAVGGVFSVFPPQAQLSQTQLEEIWERFDKDGNGALDLTEIERLVKTALDYMAVAIPNQLKELMNWEESDEEEKKEAQRRFDLMATAMANAPLPEMAKELQEFMDTNHDGMVDKSEFVGKFQAAMSTSVKKHRILEQDDPE